MSEPNLEQERPVNLAKVQGWVDRLTPQQEIHCDYYPQANGDDPVSPSWALLDLDKRQVLDFIDQNAPGPDDHSEISELLHRQEAAGRIAGIACGFYRHPARVAADKAANDQRDRFVAARSAQLDPIINQLGELAEELHRVDPSQSTAKHMRDLGSYVQSMMQAWGEDETPGSNIDEEDVPF